MKHILIIISFLLGVVNSTYSQYNLVPNYSFEENVVCPNASFGGSIPTPWYLPQNYINSFCYFHTCSTAPFASVPSNNSGFQYSKTGFGYGTLDFYHSSFTNGRGYFQTQLKNALVSGKCYYGEYWVSLCHSSKIAVNNIAMLFTDTAVRVANTYPLGYGLIPANPQVFNFVNAVITDTLNWVKVSGVFTANGGEKYITIGNFKNDANTEMVQVASGTYNKAGYYIDDIRLTPLDSMVLKADAGRDSSINPGDSVFIGSLTNGLTNVKWFNAAGNIIETIKPGFYVKPTASTFYVMEQNVCGQYSRDTVNITIKDTSTSPGNGGNSLFVVYPNPAKNTVNIKGQNIKTVELFDCLGRRLGTQNANTNPVTIPLFNLSSGMYLLRITEGNNNVTTKKFFKYQ